MATATTPALTVQPPMMWPGPSVLLRVQRDPGAGGQGDLHRGGDARPPRHQETGRHSRHQILLQTLPRHARIRSEQAQILS